jgi:L-fucose isomerase-like protein
MSDNLLLNLERLRVKLLAFPAAEISVFDKAKKKYMNLFNPEQVEFVNDKPDVLMFLTGGSERIAIELVQEYRFYLILASKDANSWASATEVKGWMNQHNISSILVNADSPDSASIVENFYHALNGIKHLHGQRLGVVGNTSDWLVSSAVSPILLQSRLGIEQVDISWSDIVFDEVKQVAPDFTSLFGNAENKGELVESGKVYEGLASLIPFYRLNALSVECFPMVNQTGHTACLALSKLNFDKIPSACEADNCSAAGLMFASEVCGTIPWMANTVFVNGTIALFAHCTAPANLLTNFKIDTHFETNKGQAIAGEVKAEEVTIFRFDSALNRIFITLAKVIGRPKLKTACRTQLEVEISTSANKYFLNNPFGNHHLLIPGNRVEVLKLAAQILRMEIVE